MDLPKGLQGKVLDGAGGRQRCRDLLTCPRVKNAADVFTATSTDIRNEVRPVCTAIGTTTDKIYSTKIHAFLLI